ncbi:MAG: hypothetical protein EBY20_00270 [Alphaproteobacteria bacterium]|uniref:Uncharacterized protein n=1 Tax=viral metagenome TaxID=1070528 RepID=A0A6C0HR56_9ZZZZ|nr:hypothetical protein [Alphaproteobacteria bacterium]
MGNSISLYSNIQSGGGEEKVITLSDSLDFIASYYILTMDFKSLSQLHEKKYCDELVVLTADIINKYFSDLEVQQLAQRVESGSEKLVYFKKSDIENLNIPSKKEYCIDIAKFYIKIAHVFAAIVTTINPEYVYKDVFGNTVKKSLMQKSEIPSGVATQVSKINLCSERINALKGKSESEDEGYSVDEEKEVEVSEINPDICTVNLDKNGETNYLDDEPGINELIDLYFDGDYDFKTGKFMGMTTETEKQFQEDLRRFYLAFTDNTDMPPDVKKFSDIKLRDYSNKKFCKSGKNGIGVKGGYKDELFLKYADNLKDMIQSVNVRQDELLSIVNKIFVYVLDPVTDKEVIRVNPDLTEPGLQELVGETRKLIIELYLKCETDFVEGVKIYEAIVESQIFNTTQKHIEQLEKEREKLISPYKQQSDKIPVVTV